MKQNEKKKRVISALFAALVVLTLISCCFLGTTFARYSSSSSGSGSAGVALWDISITGNGAGDNTAALDSTKISPDIENDFSAATDQRVNTSGKILIATISNNGEVAADVSVSLNALTFELKGGSSYGDGINTENWNSGDAKASQWQVGQVLTAKLYWDDSTTYSDGGEVSGKTQLAAKGDGTADSVYIFVELTWTSMDTYYQNENVADAIDTWIGENVTKINCSFSYTAVQASELPTT